MKDDDFLLTINLAKIHCSMGHGIDRLVCLDIINSVLKTCLISMESVLILSSALDCMMKKNSEVIQIIHGNTINPACILQDGEEVRNAEFYKIERYIELLHNMGKIPWRT